MSKLQVKFEFKSFRHKGVKIFDALSQKESKGDLLILIEEVSKLKPGGISNYRMIEIKTSSGS